MLSQRPHELLKRYLHGDTTMEVEARCFQRFRSHARESKRLTSLEAVKQCFHALINRTEAYDHPHHASEGA